MALIQCEGYSTSKKRRCREHGVERYKGKYWCNRHWVISKESEEFDKEIRYVIVNGAVNEKWINEKGRSETVSERSI